HFRRLSGLGELAIATLFVAQAAVGKLTVTFDESVGKRHRRGTIPLILAAPRLTDTALFAKGYAARQILHASGHFQDSHDHRSCVSCSASIAGQGAIMTVRRRRSMLYMPGSNARAMEKARALIVEALKKGGFGLREVLVRINGLDTAWWRDDLTVTAAGPDAVLVPKVSTPEQLREVAKHLVGVQAEANV